MSICNHNKKCVLILLLIFLTFGCKNKEHIPNHPDIELIELGDENSKIAYKGQYLHILVDIIAQGTIDNIQIIIGAVENTSYDSLLIDTILITPYMGLKKTGIHEHFDIPDSAKSGSYNFKIIVNDMNDNNSSVADIFEIVAFY